MILQAVHVPSPRHCMPAERDLDTCCGWLQFDQRRKALLLSFPHDSQAEATMIKSHSAQPEVQIYPISRIPNELLIFIFTLFVQDPDQEDTEGEHRLCHWRPVALSHVCRQWRFLALSTSCLWSRITLSKASPVPAVNHFINHTGISAIDIFGYGIDDHKLTQHPALIASECLPRWRTIAIATSGPSPMLTLLRPLYEPAIFSHLSTLKLSSGPPCRGRGTFFHGLPSPPHPEDRFPALRHIQLVEVPVYSVPVGIFRNIHTLELSNPKQDPNPLTRFHSSLLDVLSVARHLERLILSDFTPSTYRGSDPVGGGNDSQTIVLPLLREFIWYYPEVQVLRHFFSRVSTPHLRSADFSAKRNRSPSHPIAPCTFRFPFVKDLIIECDTQETLYSVTREMEFPGINHLTIQTSMDNWNPIFALPVFRWSAIFRDLRAPYLNHLTLFRLSITSDHMSGVFQYMPSLRSLTCDMCDGVANMVCALSAGHCACAVGSFLHEDHSLFELESLTLRDCDGLRFACLRNWISLRNRSREPWHYTPHFTRDRLAVVQRKIKPLSGKYKRRFESSGITPPIEESLEGLSLTQSSTTTANYIPNYLRQLSKITFISFDNCKGITAANARELQQLGVDMVEWK